MIWQKGFTFTICDLLLERYYTYWSQASEPGMLEGRDGASPPLPPPDKDFKDWREWFVLPSFFFFWGGLARFRTSVPPPHPHFQFASDTYNCSYADNILSILSGIIWKVSKQEIMKFSKKYHVKDIPVQNSTIT